MQAVLAIIFFLFFWIGLLGISLFVTFVLAFIAACKAGFRDPYGTAASLCKTEEKNAVVVNGHVYSKKGASGAAWRYVEACDRWKHFCARLWRWRKQSRGKNAGRNY